MCASFVCIQRRRWRQRRQWRSVQIYKTRLPRLLLSSQFNSYLIKYYNPHRQKKTHAFVESVGVLLCVKKQQLKTTHITRYYHARCVHLSIHHIQRVVCAKFPLMMSERTAAYDARSILLMYDHCARFNLPTDVHKCVRIDLVRSQNLRGVY